MTDHVCRHCEHWKAPDRETEAEMVVGTCKAEPPKPFLMFRQEQNLITQRIDMVPEVHSAWPPVVAHETCAHWLERRQ